MTVFDGDGAIGLQGLPRWVLLVGPVLILGVVVAILWVTSPFGDLDGMGEAGLVELLWMLTIIGVIAGIVPVAIGMLWFPFIRTLDPRWLHAFLALAAGVLVFVAIEMTDGMLEYGSQLDSLPTAVAVGALGVLGTFGGMYWLSYWRQQQMAAVNGKSGLQVAYLVALALGLHSIGEGLAIGSAFVLEEYHLVTLLVIGFVMHNITEGPTVVAAVARDTDVPPLRHFAAMGTIAGGPVILGGWIGSLAYLPILATLFFAIALGAILQVAIEMVDLIRMDSGQLLTLPNAVGFVIGLVGMFLLEDVLVEAIVFA